MNTEVRILEGKCENVLSELADNSVDSVVTDPPYGLKFMGKKWDYDVPKTDVWKEAIRVLKPGGHLLCFGGTRTFHRMVVNIEDAGFEIRDCISWVYGSGFPKSHNISKAIAPSDGKDWNGWGTALKPSFEPICVARKPLSEKTIADNVLKWGTGAINIDGCRVGLNGDYKCRANGRPSQTGLPDNYKSDEANKSDNKGRWPANLCHDGSEEVEALFPYSKSGAMKKDYKYTNSGVSMGKPSGSTKARHESNEGSASRFFYCAKASKQDREEGLTGFEKKRSGGMRGSLDGSMKTAGGKDRNIMRANNHPTVKPTSLMQWLVRLVTPPGGTVLDPFMGSGSTGKACVLEGFNFVGIEMNAEYIEIAKSRIKWAEKNRSNQLKAF